MNTERDALLHAIPLIGEIAPGPREIFIAAMKTGDWAIRVFPIESAPELWQVEVKFRGKVRYAMLGARTTADAREFAISMITGAAKGRAWS